MKRVYKKLGDTTVVVVEQRTPVTNALEAQRFVIVAEINAMRAYVLNTGFSLRCQVLEKIVEDIDTILGDV